MLNEIAECGRGILRWCLAVTIICDHHLVRLDALRERVLAEARPGPRGVRPYKPGVGRPSFDAVEYFTRTMKF